MARTASVVAVAALSLQSASQSFASSTTSSPWSLARQHAWGNSLVGIQRQRRFPRADAVEKNIAAVEEYADDDFVLNRDSDEINLISNQSENDLLDQQDQPCAPSRRTRDTDLVQLTLSRNAVDTSSPLSLNEDLSARLNSHDSSSSQQQQNKIRLRSTGTTIVGCLVDGCVVLGADTRATNDRIVADKRCEKVHCLASNVWCCGAGTSADLDALTREIRYTLALRNLLDDSIGNDEIQNYNNNEVAPPQEARGVFTRPVRSVSSVCRTLRDTLYNGRGSIGANLVLGGYDLDSRTAVLVAIHPHGSMDVVPYSALGSGGLAAMSVLESSYHGNLTLQEGIALVKEAVKAGIDNDLGSGSQIDVIVLGPNGTNYTRGAVPEEELQATTSSEVQQPAIVESEDSIEGEATRDSLEGVNGFGNLAYRVKSTRVLLQSHEAEKKERQKTWNDILGID